MRMLCDKCGHEWDYQGKSKYYASCPQCKKSVKISQEDLAEDTFKNWMIRTFTKDEMKDIAEHGCSGGFPGLTYYHETIKLYDHYDEEIWDNLYDDSQDMGSESILDFIKSFNGADTVGSDAQFKNLLVWYLAEKYARELTEEDE